MHCLNFNTSIERKKSYSKNTLNVTRNTCPRTAQNPMNDFPLYLGLESNYQGTILLHYSYFQALDIMESHLWGSRINITGYI